MAASGHFEKLQVAISQQLVIRSASCLVLGWGFEEWRIQRAISGWIKCKMAAELWPFELWSLYIRKVLTRCSDMAIWSFFTKWPPAAILDLIKPDIVPFDPPSWKTPVRLNSKWRPFWKKLPVTIYQQRVNTICTDHAFPLGYHNDCWRIMTGGFFAREGKYSRPIRYKEKNEKADLEKWSRK